MKNYLRNNQFLVGSILHADELSITVVPAAANFGAHSNDVSPPAENKAISGCIATAVANPTTLMTFTIKVISLPTDLSEATRINSSVSDKNFLCQYFQHNLSNHTGCPTTAIFILYFYN
jgi:hypothetical protein